MRWDHSCQLCRSAPAHSLFLSTHVIICIFVDACLAGWWTCFCRPFGCCDAYIFLIEAMVERGCLILIIFQLSLLRFFIWSFTWAFESGLVLSFWIISDLFCRDSFRWRTVEWWAISYNKGAGKALLSTLKWLDFLFFLFYF